MVTQTESIKTFLKVVTHPELSAMYNQGMEVQVNVAQDNGERIKGDFKGKTWNGYTDGVQTWKPFRIPFNANTEPTYDQSTQMKFDLAAHAEAIGMTGWDYLNQVSKWVAFDFDAIVGHSERHDKRLPDEQLNQIRELVSNVPWVTVRHSTGGRGLHLYVMLPDVPTINHTEHAALARYVLGVLSATVSYDFNAVVDTCGSNIWVWHRKLQQADNPNGLKLIKQGTVFTDIKPTWREHIAVINGKRKRTIPSFISDSQSEEVERLFEELANQKVKAVVDEGHKKLIQYLAESGSYWDWKADHQILITHTASLKKAHDALGLRGIFRTLAAGADPGDHNCWLVPIRNSEWVVRRYSPGVAEESTWTQDGGAGWTTCYFNRDPDLRTASSAHDGLENEKGHFVFPDAEQGQKAALMLGFNLELPPFARSRQLTLRPGKDNRIIAQMDAVPSLDKADQLKGWIQEKKKWTRVFYYKGPAAVETESGSYDDIIRHLITQQGEDYGWTIKTEDGWLVEPLVHARIFLQTLGLQPKEVLGVLGSSIAKCWTIVNRPFEPEYPGDRIWNRKSAQLAFVPSADRDNLNYSHFLKILDHCGKSLDEKIKENPWAKANGIQTGSDYLKCWIASLLQFPKEPLPYLFFYGPQNSGKSIFHEMLELLITGGVVRADTALVSKSGFNGELENAVLCVVEETDLRADKQAYSRIKDWVTATKLPVHAKRETPYTVVNTTHWCQFANHIEACPAFPGDTRITMIEVGPLETIIPKTHLLSELRKEAPDFLAEILNMEVPPTNDRLNVPIIITSDKVAAMSNNRTALQVFLDENVHCVPGKYLLYGEVYNKFIESLDPGAVHTWTKHKFGKELPKPYIKGRSPQNNQVLIGNASWEPRQENEVELNPLVLDGEKLVYKAS